MVINSYVRLRKSLVGDLEIYRSDFDTTKTIRCAMTRFSDETLRFHFWKKTRRQGTRNYQNSGKFCNAILGELSDRFLPV